MMADLKAAAVESTTSAPANQGPGWERSQAGAWPCPP